MKNSLLQVRGLSVSFDTGPDTIRAVRDVSFDIHRGEVLGLVGESGSGKTVTALSLLGLIDPQRSHVAGSARLRGQELLNAPPWDLRSLRGRRIGLIPQDAPSALNPVLTVGTQLALALRAHRNAAPEELADTAVAALARVGIDDPTDRLRQYPHELSGGMQQRVAVALGLLHQPDLLIADEATSALDLSTQARVVHEVLEGVRNAGTALLWISHDLDLLSQVADRCLVLYAGQVVESGTTGRLLAEPRHPYTRALLDASPSRTQPGERLLPIPGQPPHPTQIPRGCAFAPRCSHATDRCAEPVSEHRLTDGMVRCVHPLGGPSR